MKGRKTKANDFDDIAGVYDSLASLIFGMTIKRSQLELLKYIKKGDKVLIVGGGTGWILPYIYTKSPGLIHYVDASQKMISLARKKVDNSLCPVNFIRQSIFEYRDTVQYDVVITFFVLDVFSQNNLNMLMSKLKSYLKQDGLWLFADFNASNQWQHVLIKIMYGFFKVTCNLENSKLHSFDCLFDRFRLRLIENHEYYGGMIQSKVYGV